MMQKQWKDLFNEKTNIPKNNIDIIDEHLKSSGSYFYIKDNIPQSVIKKSKKTAYKKQISIVE